MKKETEKFDPNAPTSSEDGIFGLPESFESAAVILQGVPWEVTTSYGGGTADGPSSILEASSQLDLFHLGFGNAYEAGIYMEPISDYIYRQNTEFRKKASWVMKEMLSPNADKEKIQSLSEEINKASDELNQTVYESAKKIIDAGKIPGLVGGDHSTPFGNIKAVAEKHKDYSVLHIDAHHDLREAYQGFTHSHASIFYNVMNSGFAPSQLVQVGIRDFCEEEHEMAKENSNIETFYDRDIANRSFNGGKWADEVKNIVNNLGENVYISCDIDGLSPDFCPNTGTPVPGGLNYRELCYLFEAVAKEKKIVGFDVVEVAPSEDNEINAIVGARVLFELCGCSLRSQGKA